MLDRSANSQAKEVSGQQGRPANVFWLPELDGLRSLAFILVFYHHTVGLFWRDNPGRSTFYHFLFSFDEKIHNWGWIGVDLFFVLSAFLITSLLLKERESNGQKTISLKKFFARRILRIWPLYFCYLILVALLSLLLKSDYTGANLASPDQGPAAWEQLMAFVFFVGNFAVIFQGPILHLLNPMWSLCIEEQFYIVWGLSMKLLKKNVYLIAVLVAAGLAAPALRYYLWSHDGKNYIAIYLNSLCHCDAIVYGGLAAFVWRRFADKFKNSAFLQILSALATVAFLAPLAWLPYIEQIDSSLCWVISSIGLGFTALLFTTMSSKLLRSFFASPLLTHVGRLTYGLYIFHFMVIYSLVYVGRTELHIASRLTYMLISWPLGLTITYILARLSWRFIEAPCLTIKERFKAAC